MALELDPLPGLDQRREQRCRLHVRDQHLVTALIRVGVERQPALPARQDRRPDHRSSVGLAVEAPALES